MGKAENEPHPEENSHQIMSENSSKVGLLIALLYIWLAPRRGLGLNPDEIRDGRQFLAPKNKEIETVLLQEVKIKQQVQIQT